MWKVAPILLAPVMLLGASGPGDTFCTPGPYILFFKKGSDAPRPFHREVMPNVLRNDAYCEGANIVVEGHIDAGEAASLSATRAARVRDYLVKRGVNAKRIRIRDAGATEPRQNNTMPDEGTPNARVEIYWSS
ncbi:OmpA family protein [Sphingomonas sp. G-3-2-10]|uniref:OmpA family protein n=1 Tax=Sphingomonas sp. G-3-2-10 TaxID=2728838 RepID=UPI00146EC371|nr:OmpA family protein [Sphingomonas sp. G-3-2-10]NML05506.1 OmpA family protein [Sphingomonas sp. G-3-2-10]